MRLVRRLLFPLLFPRLLGRRRPTARPRPGVDSERLEQIYRETHRAVEALRRAA